MIIHWFRQDLRLSDNPAFAAAVQQGSVLPIYILDDVNAQKNAMGGASRWWLHHSLMALQASLNGALAVYEGDAKQILPHLVKRLGVKAIYWNRCYEPWRIARDKEIRSLLEEMGVSARSFNSALLWEPWEVKKKDGTPYQVFTPFYRHGCLQAPTPREPLAAPSHLKLLKDDEAQTIDDLNLLPTTRWDKQLEPHWQIGETAAQKRLASFLKKELPHYKDGRNFPAHAAVSRLSAHLHFGEISPNQAWYAVQSQEPTVNTSTFCTELGWREFSHHLLYYHPTLPHENLQKKFDAFPWQRAPQALKRWQQGQTGYPIVDAGMRELWQTGYMHNRVRMIVGSFLVKNLRIDWREGERWFWDCLVDADLANNSASWQWIAGCGADAAPYFRVFNPITQGEKFDAAGEYTRRFVPELKHLPDKYLFAPWKAPEAVLRKAGIVLGETYPEPMVDAAQSRILALEAFASLKRQ